jgi:flagellar biosynthesis chaperone FliJ
MKRFQFAFERVLAWRNSELQIEEAALENLIGEQYRVAELKRMILAELDQERALLAAQVAIGNQLSAFSEYRAAIELKVAGLNHAITEYNKRITEQRGRVLEFRRRSQLLEKLKDRRRSEWQAGFDRELEQIASDAHLARIAREGR